MTFIYQTILHTPFWVWLLLAFLLWRGWQRTKPQLVSPATLVVMPLVTLLLAARRIFITEASASSILTTLAGLVVGIALMMVMKPGRSVQWVEDGRLLLPGEWVSLGLYFGLFVMNYVSGVMSALAPDQSLTRMWTDACTIFNGASLGFMGLTILSYFARRPSSVAA